ncbi:MAG TPA: HNH endonuclease [Pseudomonadales bacterium]|nr:HNH endonuclease [Pseudomonadales bacterium]
MTTKGWTRQQLLIAFGLYCQMPFGKMHSRNPEIVKYAELINRTPSALAMKLTNIASLDPAIISTGRKGLSGASSADKKMWEEMQKNWETFALESDSAMIKITKSEDRNDTSEPDEKDEDDHTGFDKEIKTKVRIGQSFFRRSVLSAYNYKCCITGLSLPKLLVASHIIPWRSDPSNRLNPRNGLSLSVLHDKAFDLGIITINNDMTIRVSNVRDSKSDQFYQSAIKSYDKKPIASPEKFAPLQEFLAYHRDNIFQG